MKDHFEVKFRVAELNDHPGYKEVIAHLLEGLESLAIRMEQSQTHEVDISLLAEWKATRKIIKELRAFPEMYAEEISQMQSIG